MISRIVGYTGGARLGADCAVTTVRELIVNPLLLTVSALVQRYRAQLPDRRVEGHCNSQGFDSSRQSQTLWAFRSTCGPQSPRPCRSARHRRPKRILDLVARH